MNELDEYFCEELDLLKRISLHNAHIVENPPRAPEAQGQAEKVSRSPFGGLLSPGFEYVPASKTDVRKTWERFGFVPKTP